MFELVSKSRATNMWVTSKKNVFKNCKLFKGVKKKEARSQQPHPDLMVARKLRTAAICKAPSSGLWENFHGDFLIFQKRQPRWLF